MSSNTERKRSLSTAFEHPTTPTRNAKTIKINTPGSNTKENDRQGHDMEMTSPIKACTPHQRHLATPRGAPLQELVEVPKSNGLALRPKLTLGEDAPEGHEVEGQWEKAPFTIWEDVDAVANRMSLRGVEE